MQSFSFFHLSSGVDDEVCVDVEPGKANEWATEGEIWNIDPTHSTYEPEKEIRNRPVIRYSKLPTS